MYILAIASLFLRNGDKRKFHIPILVALGLLYITLNPIYSPMDEGAHVDAINYIIDNHELSKTSDIINHEQLKEAGKDNIPKGLQYEAYQPPLYYIISAAVTYPFSVYWRVIFLRFIGLLSLVITYVIITKICELVCETEGFPLNEIQCSLVILAFLVLPGTLSRSITISNEHLAVPLASFIYYQIFSIYIKQREISMKSCMILAISCGLLVLTKLTGVFLVLIAGALLIYKKEYRKTILFAVIGACMVLPWLIYNYSIYGALTAQDDHVKIVKPIVNAKNVQVDILYCLERIPKILRTFWFPQEMTSPFSPIYMMLSSFLYLGLTMIVFNWKKIKISPIILAGILLHSSIIFFGSISQNIPLVSGRYFYINIVPIIFVVIYFIAQFDKRNTSMLLSTFLFFCCLANTDYMQKSSGQSPFSDSNNHASIKLYFSESGKAFSEKNTWKFNEISIPFKTQLMSYKKSFKNLDYMRVDIEGAEQGKFIIDSILLNNGKEYDIDLSTIQYNDFKVSGDGIVIVGDDPFFSFSCPEEIKSYKGDVTISIKMEGVSE